MPNLVELNWVEAIRNSNRAVKAVDIELTIVPASPVWNKVSLMTKGNNIKWVIGSHTPPS
jgi:hypothetical protein